MGEVYRPGAARPSDVRPPRHPLEELAKRAPRPQLPKVVLVCNVCGRRFTDLLEAWAHQRSTGHESFRLELFTV